ncbi:CO/xanthine dehydrogenase FAD-binding subunit [Flavimobilis soli]|uniref:CO/xanthine dehydrogenase FAD-binding subunit n=1 Tax=Flavimobilis soli TaxID=442709 RepID=A0A2A9EDZ1_9MICO|nr:FAD binding domain-containing protein [Flavimobilis soli]PFG37267.1 CO/xanthine dehydrogenase FAD-binding subunit [Flavimobilis soli]
MDLTTVTSYRHARTVDDLDLAPGEVFVAGGTWLFSEPQPGVTGLVDLTTLGWDDWQVLPDGDLRIGATCTVERLQQIPADVVGPAASLVRACADAFLMSFKIQTAATVGGNLAMALPAGAMISLMSSLDATAVVWGPGGPRREPVESFVRGVRETSLEPGEVLRAIDVPRRALVGRHAMRKIALAKLGRSSCVVVGRVDLDGSATVTVTAATPRPAVLRFATIPTADDLRDAVAQVGADVGWYADAHGPADWRAAMAAELAEQVRAELAAPGPTRAEHATPAQAEPAGQEDR